MPKPAHLTWLVPIVNTGLVSLVAYLPMPAGRIAEPRERPVITT